MEQPDGRQIRSGLKTLEELGALNEQGKLTAIGRDLARLPVDPRLGRMLLASIKQQNIDDVLIIVSALAVQDPREMPADKRQAADQSHRRFWHKRSDFLAWINLWHYYEEHRVELSENHLRKLCKKSYLSYPRMREWRDLHRQLLLSVKPLLQNKHRNNPSSKTEPQNPNAKKADVKPTREWLTNESGDNVDDLHQFIFSTADIEKIHCALLTGLPSNLGLKENKGEYRGARNLKFFLFPASSQFKSAPQWVMSAEIVETRKVYARSIAAIDPLWVIAAVPHLVKHEYNEPHWDAKRGQVMAFRSTTLYGLVLASRQLIAFEQIDAEAARLVFIQQALAAGHLQANEKLRKRALFWQHNIDLIAEITLLEEKIRRRDLLVDEVALAAFYQRHLPDNVLSRRGLEQWLRNASPEEQKKLFLSRSDVLLTADGDDVVEQFPDSIQVAGQ